MSLVALCRKILSHFSLRLLALISIFGISACGQKSLNDEQVKRLYTAPAPKPTDNLNLYYLGHSLIGRDIPAMVQQLAGPEHDYRSQLGWGATLQSHWEPNIAISGFKEENSHAKYRDAFDAIDSQDYDAFVLTEMVEIKDAIKYFDSAKYLGKFAQRIHQQSPKTTIYFYETWHEVTDPRGWQQRLDEDYEQYWLGKILYPAIAQLDGKVSIYVVPVGQAMSAFFSALKGANLPGKVQGPEDIFARSSDGKLDPIHLNDIGEYLSALVHYSVIYQKSPLGLSHTLTNADGSEALSPTKEVAELMQRITWEVVKNDFRTGVNAAHTANSG